MDVVLDWMRERPGLLIALAAASVVMFAASVLVTPMLVARLPADYFAHRRRPPGTLDRLRPGWRWSLMAVKNAAGAALLVAGVAMLVLPGQGLLTLLAGLLLIDLPGKYRAQKWLVRRRGVLGGLNWVRRRAGRSPLVLDRPPRRLTSGEAEAAGPG